MVDTDLRDLAYGKDRCPVILKGGEQCCFHRGHLGGHLPRAVFNEFVDNLMQDKPTLGKKEELRPVLPTGAKERNEYPMAEGLLYYFPAALAEVARLSKIGNDQHNPGEPMHWARDKSTDHANKIMKHLVDAGLIDTDGVRHSVKAAWRALALAEIELEEAGYPKARNAR